MNFLDSRAARTEGNYRTPPFGTRHKLKAVLAVGDATAIMLSYALSGWGTGYSARQGLLRTVIVSAFSVLAGLWALRSQGLYLSRVSAVRVVEISRTARGVALLAGIVLLGDRLGHFDWHVRETLVASLVCFLLLCIVRSAYRAWLANARERGLYCRRIVIIGTDNEAVRLLNLFKTHRDVGLTVVGIVGDRAEAVRCGVGDLWLGDGERPEDLLHIAGLSGVVASAGGMSSSRLNDLIRILHSSGLHIHLSTGVSGIDVRRLRSLPLAHEPLLYVEAPSLARAQFALKRCFDVVVASFALVLVSPILISVAIAIKLDDAGPILFSQARVGRSGRSFRVLKFRSMRVDAETRLADLAAGNERQGPLFKMDQDPRVTRVGRFLRSSSLDELPQLWNVLRGEMSLVGPRPALPAEVASFSLELRERERVLPGITGLWQVEARDNPSFEAYRRLDLFYVENWSIVLDLMILIGTVEQLVVRMLRSVRTHRVATSSQTGAVEVAVVEDVVTTLAASGGQ
ncbi:MAG: sugar transferase [Ilumatobacteraceae bacterium]|nr:sugar transferase [Ilumatobacteraceae bacterium]